MKVGTNTGGRSGYITQKPTDSMNACASSRVRIGSPFVRHFFARNSRSSRSVMFFIFSPVLNTFESFLNISYRITQDDRSSMRTAHGIARPGQFAEQPLHFGGIQ